jgi:hypothetical protein
MTHIKSLKFPIIAEVPAEFSDEQARYLVIVRLDSNREISNPRIRRIVNHLSSHAIKRLESGSEPFYNLHQMYDYRIPLWDVCVGSLEEIVEDARLTWGVNEWDWQSYNGTFFDLTEEEDKKKWELMSHYSKINAALGKE